MMSTHFFGVYVGILRADPPRNFTLIPIGITNATTKYQGIIMNPNTIGISLPIIAAIGEDDKQTNTKK
jgi:hypothetical protein